MKILADDGYLKPELQIGLGLVVAVYNLIAGAVSTIDGRFFGLNHIFLFAAGTYAAWYAYKKKTGSS